MRKKHGLFIAILVCFIGTGIYYFAHTGCGAKVCGESLPQKIRYKGSPTMDNSAPRFRPLEIAMLSIKPDGDKSVLLFHVLRILIDKKNEVKQLISTDRGMTWNTVDWLFGYGNLGDMRGHWVFGKDKRMSHIDFRVIYDCYYKCKDGFPVSIDGGKTWTHVKPVLEDGGSIEEIELIDTGMHSVSRLYARIQSGKDVRIGVSDDYGRSFRLFQKGLDDIVESRASSSVLYGRMNRPYFESTGLKAFDDEFSRLGVSKDGGKSWKVMKGSLEITGHKIYRSATDREENRSWRQYPDDEEWPVSDGIMQIESDPKHPEYVYVLTTRGLYISRDTGKTFYLSSLAKGWLYSIDRIAVDPLDGRYLYAVVDIEKFYRSSDYGCTWELMPPPVLPE